MSELTVTGALARAVSKLRAVASYQRTAGSMSDAVDEDRTAERIGAFLDALADRAGRYLVSPDSVASMRAAASDVRDGRWRRT